MSRNKQRSSAKDLMDLIALMPWWAGIALALLSYLVLQAVAVRSFAIVTQPGQLGSQLTHTVWHAFAAAGQYFVPVLCLAGAVLSVWRRAERRRLVGDAAQGDAADAIDGMSWQQFERLVGEAFRLRGYRVVETGQGGADGGVDLVLSKGGEKFLVQCKQWRAFKVGVDVVRELYGVMAAKGAAGGFVVTSGRFTDEANSFAQGRNVVLVDGVKLRAMIEQAKAADKPSERQSASQSAPFATAAGAVPSCPLCAKPMLGRFAKRGANAGRSFWGCAGYPACKGTRAIS
jgi:restriction system protein